MHEPEAGRSRARLIMAVSFGVIGAGLLVFLTIEWIMRTVEAS